MTEKDASKCKDFKNSKIWYLTIEAEIDDRFFDQLKEKLHV
jgi:tetraacyldisaccharide-1-P 4'-kinase